MTRCYRIAFAALGLLCGMSAWGATTPAATPADDAPHAIALALANAYEQTLVTRHYDPAYVRLAYPGGDLPAERGVCADVIVRALRAAGTDLQQRVHEDMARNFTVYPRRWGAAHPDANIDHRRVANLMTYFARQGKALPQASDARDYRPGDIVAWDLGGGLLHIGMVSDMPVAGADRYAVVHNIGAGARLEDVLFQWRIVGHYRYF